jgi:Zn finger protein HypA/HybF involved in hydrogenase expression
VDTSPLDKDALNMVVRRGANSCAYCSRNFNKQYHSVFTPECENEELPSLTDNYPSMPEITVTANGTEKLLSNTFRCKYRMILFV